MAICDQKLIGKKFEEKSLQLDLTSDFYNGEEKSEKEIKKIIYDAYIVNMVGENSVALGLNLGIILKENIIYTKKVPHAQAILN